MNRRVEKPVMRRAADLKQGDRARVAGSRSITVDHVVGRPYGVVSIYYDTFGALRLDAAADFEFFVGYERVAVAS